MLLLITVLILFTYTVVLLMFFMGWCALLPKIAHPRPEVVPFSVVKSPRRNSVFISFESIPSISAQSLEHLHQKLSITSGFTNSSASHIPSNSSEKTKRSSSTPNTSASHSPSTKESNKDNTKKDSKSGNSLYSEQLKFTPQNDYLHPKYSLPPIKIDIVDHLIADQHLLRTPVHLHCSPIKARSKSFEYDEINHDENIPLSYLLKTSGNELKRKLGMDKSRNSLSPSSNISSLESAHQHNELLITAAPKAFIV